MNEDRPPYPESEDYTKDPRVEGVWQVDPRRFRGKPNDMISYLLELSNYAEAYGYFLEFYYEVGGELCSEWRLKDKNGQG